MRADGSFRLALIICLFGMIYAEKITLWDFGVIIKEEQSQIPATNVNAQAAPEIKALISDPFIAPKKSSEVQFHQPVEKVSPIRRVTGENFREVEKFIQRHTLQKNFNHIIQSLEDSDLTELTLSNRAEIQFWLATSFIETGQFQKALPYALWAGSNRGSDRDLFLTAKIYEKTGETAKALYQYQQLMSLYPDSDYYHSAKIKSRIIARS